MGSNPRKSPRQNQKELKPTRTQTTTINGLKGFYTNADTLTNKKEELLTRISEETPDFIGITEVKPKNSRFPTQESDLKIPGYDCWSEFKNGRGVALYVRNHLNSLPIETPGKKDIIFCEIRLRKKTRLLLGCMYRSPNATQAENVELNETLRWASSLNHELMTIMGDFNYREINWQTRTVRASANHPATSFLDTIDDLFLNQIVETPTHHRGEQQPTLIDLLMTNEENLITVVRHEAPLGSSHHDCLSFNLNCMVDVCSPPRTVLRYHDADFTSMRDQVRSHKWQVDFTHSPPEDICSELTGVILDAVQAYVPKRVIDPSRPSRKKELWMTREALEAVKAKKKAYNEGDRNAYKKARNHARKATRKARADFERKIADEAKQDPKAFYRMVNSRTKVTSSIAELETNGKISSSDAEKAKTLNEFFASVFTVEDLQDIPDVNRRADESILDVNFTIEQVKTRLLSLNPNKAPGPDNLHPRILKEMAEEIAEPIYHLFRRSLDSGKLPNIWKTANVTPIYKKGRRSDPGNYRPVSLTSQLVKILESLITSSIVNFLETHDLLSDDQFGFRSKRSCAWQLLKVMEEWTDLLENGNSIDCIYFDLRKAFDKVPHQRLLRKLNSYGIGGKLLKWIETYLTGRTQKVRVNTALSDQEPVWSGVPQGSILGPMLFVVYMNDLTDEVHSQTKMFADDTKMYGVADSADSCQRIQEDITTLEHWAKKWQMSFHPDKCKILRIGSGHAPFTYTMEGEHEKITLATENEEKDLGVITDTKLSFVGHIDSAVTRANQKLGMMKRGFTHLTKDTFTRLYKSMVRPILEYAHAVWRPPYKKDLIKIEKIQRRATKLVPQLKCRSYKERLKALDLPSMQYRLRRGDMIEVWKILNNHYKGDFKWLRKIEDSSTRSNDAKLHYPRYSHPLKLRCFSNRIQSDWRTLPRQVVSASTVNCFKTKLDRHWRDEMFEFPGP